MHGRAGYSNDAAYDISKGGVDALTRYVAVEYGQLRIRCNAVAPGGVRTPLLERVVRGEAEDPDAAERGAIRPHPLGRIAAPSEIAAVVAFLLGSESSFVSGQSLAADGAMTARCCDFPLAAGLRRFLRPEDTDAVCPQDTDALCAQDTDAVCPQDTDAV